MGKNIKEGYSFIHKWLNKNTSAEGKCLEIGCGPGQYMPSVNGCYIGLDINFLRYLRDKENSRKPDVIASGRWLPFKENHFDIIFCVASFYFIPGPLFSLIDCLRVLKRKGTLIIFDYTEKTLLRLAKGFYIEKIEHTSIWNTTQLKKLFKYAGFVRVKQLINQPQSFTKRMVASIYKYTLLHTPIHDMKEGWNIIVGTKP